MPGSWPGGRRPTRRTPSGSPGSPRWACCGPSFVPPPEIRALRDLTRTRLQLVRDRTREWQRLEKLLEGALIKLSSVVSLAWPGPRPPAASWRPSPPASATPRPWPPWPTAASRAGTPRVRQSLEGMLLGESPPQADPDSPGPHHSPGPVGRRDRGRDRGRPGRDPRRLGHQRRRRPVPGPRTGRGGADRCRSGSRRSPASAPRLAMAIIAETGLDMTRFPTAAHLVSWAGLAPVARQSGPRNRKPSKGPRRRLPEGLLHPGRQRRRPHRHLPRRTAPPPHQGASAGTGPSAPSAAPSSSSSGTCSPSPDARFTDLGPGWHDA